MGQPTSSGRPSIANEPSLLISRLSYTSGFIRRNSTECAFSGDAPWVVLTPIEQSIKRKIEAVGTPLKDWDVKIYRGILTGCNDAFIIDEAKRAELIAADPKSAEIIRPILRGRDIKRYGYEWAHLYLIATFPSRHYNIENYPAVKEHLLTFDKARLQAEGYSAIANNPALLRDFCYKRLDQKGVDILINGQKVIISGKTQKSRKKTGNQWFETSDQIAYWDDFSKQKILYPDIMRMPKEVERLKDYPKFFLDKDGFFPEATLFLITGEDLEALLCYLCSDVVFFIFTKFFAGPQFDSTGFRYKKEYLATLPVPHSDSNFLSGNYDEWLINKLGLTSSEVECIKQYKYLLLSQFTTK